MNSDNANETLLFVKIVKIL